MEFFKWLSYYYLFTETASYYNFGEWFADKSHVNFYNESSRNLIHLDMNDKKLSRRNVSNDPKFTRRSCKKRVLRMTGCSSYGHFNWSVVKNVKQLKFFFFELKKDIVNTLFPIGIAIIIVYSIIPFCAGRKRYSLFHTFTLTDLKQHTNDTNRDSGQCR